jgi:hypothetical protein
VVYDSPDKWICQQAIPLILLYLGSGLAIFAGDAPNKHGAFVDKNTLVHVFHVDKIRHALSDTNDRSAKGVVRLGNNLLKGRSSSI